MNRIAADFPTEDSAAQVRELVAASDDSERMRAAIVLAAKGDLSSVEHLVELVKVDWRDVLVAGNLANDDWREKLDQELGPPS
jgi:hypothetical protein